MNEQTTRFAISLANIEIQFKAEKTVAMLEHNEPTRNFQLMYLMNQLEKADTS